MSDLVWSGQRSEKETFNRILEYVFLVGEVKGVKGGGDKSKEIHDEGGGGVFCVKQVGDVPSDPKTGLEERRGLARRKVRQGEVADSHGSCRAE